MPQMVHQLDAGLLQERVRVLLVGIGGNGAQMATRLARLDIAMRALGHPYGLHVTALDADVVSDANIGRQIFSPSDVGQNKAVVTITRINHFFGLDYAAYPARFEHWWPAGQRTALAHLIISCVDSRAARRMIHGQLAEVRTPVYWMDLGNREADGQVVLGQACMPPRQLNKQYRLPCVTELFPDLLDASVQDDVTDSCSLPIALASQGLFINDLVVSWAAHLLFELFSCGQLSAHGVFCNAAAKRTSPIPVSVDAWGRYGHVATKGGYLSRLE